MVGKFSRAIIDEVEIEPIVTSIKSNMNSFTVPLRVASGADLYIPAIGLGVYQSEPGAETYNAVLSALRIGYRYIL